VSCQPTALKGLSESARGTGGQGWTVKLRIKVGGTRQAALHTHNYTPGTVSDHRLADMRLGVSHYAMPYHAWSASNQANTQHTSRPRRGYISTSEDAVKRLDSKACRSRAERRAGPGVPQHDQWLPHASNPSSPLIFHTWPTTSSSKPADNSYSAAATAVCNCCNTAWPLLPYGAICTRYLNKRTNTESKMDGQESSLCLMITNVTA